MESSNLKSDVEKIDIGVILSQKDKADIDTKLALEIQKFEQDHINDSLKLPAIILFLLTTLSLIIYQNSNLSQDIRDSFGLDLEVSIRDRLGMHPLVNSKLKLIVFDDTTMGKLQKENLSLMQWAKMLKKIDAQNPEGIYIDKVFGILSDYSEQESAAMEVLRNLNTQVFTGSFQSPYRIPKRPILANNNSTNYADRLLPLPEKLLSQLKDSSNLFTYGAHKKLAEHFIPGHILLDHSYQIDFTIPITKSLSLPHLGVRRANHIRWDLDSNQVFFDNVPIDHRDGKIIVNFLNPRRYYKNTKRVDTVLAYSKAKMDRFIKKGDTVIILPTFYTGSGGFKDSPYGRINSGFIIANTINSYLNQNWLQYFGLDHTFLYLCAYVGIALLAVNSGASVIFAAMFPFFLFLFGIGLYVYGDTVSIWREWMMAFVLTGFVSLFLRRQIDKNIGLETADKLSKAKLLANEKLIAEAHGKVLLDEKKQAAEVAKTLRPDPPPEDWPFLNLDCFHTCFDAASGDWFFFDKSNSNQFFHIGLFDISGHGIQAALIVSCLRSTLFNLKRNRPEIFERSDFFHIFAHEVNETLFYQGGGNHTTTFCGVTLQEGSQKVELVACGHPPAILIDRSTKVITRIKARSNLLGIESNYQSKHVTFHLNEDTDLYLYTDGCPFNENMRILRKMVEAENSDEIADAKTMALMFAQKLKDKKGKIIDDDVSVIRLRR